MNRLVLVLGAICLVIMGACGFYIYELRAQTSQLRIQTALLSENISKAEAIQLSNRKDLETYAQSVGLDIQNIQKDIKILDGRLIAVGSAVAKVEGKIKTNQPSTSTDSHKPPSQPLACDLCDVYRYTANIQHYDLRLEKLNFGQVTFDASQEKPWSLELYPLTTKYAFTLAQKEDETLILHGKMFVQRSDDQTQQLEISVESQLFQVKKPEKKWMWAPHLDLSLDNLLIAHNISYRFGVSFGWSAFAYGRTKNDNSWRLLRIAVGLDNTKVFNVQVHPLSYNLGDLLPLISDAWFSVGFVYNLNMGIVFSLNTTL